ncbi:MAG: hypothetical protein PHN88_07655 [Ignavibacteria bacterium]|nr:hypothetical protein [Ignavibacteria bacterium]
MENRDFYFRKFVILTVTIFVISSAVIFMFYKDLKIDFVSFLSAGIINVLNSVIGFKILLKSLVGDQKRFYFIGLGSMVVRLFVVLIAVLVGLLAFKLNKISFIFALFFFYFLYLIIETYLLVNRINKLKRIDT